MIGFQGFIPGGWLDSQRSHSGVRISGLLKAQLVSQAEKLPRQLWQHCSLWSMGDDMTNDHQ